MAQTRDGIRATVYAPDWTWRGQDLNFLIVFENDSEQARSVTVRLAVTGDGEFALPSGETQPITIAAGGVARFAFSNIGTAEALTGHRYDFLITVEESGARSAGPVAEFAVPVALVRGPVVSQGIWAAILPAAVAGAWCLVFAWYLRRHARRGAWKTPSAPVWESIPRM